MEADVDGLIGAGLYERSGESGLARNIGPHLEVIGVDLPSPNPSFITRLCRFHYHNDGFRFGRYDLAHCCLMRGYSPEKDFGDIRTRSEHRCNVRGNALQRLSDRFVLRAVGFWGWVVQTRVMLFYLKRSLPSGRLPCLGLPQTVDDKFMWRKLFDHDPLFTTLCDKVAVKTWVRKAFPDVETAPLLWVGVDPVDIPEQVLAGDVIVKANHGCGTNRIIRGGAYSHDELISEARRWLATDHGKGRREWGYVNIARRILVEPLMVDATSPVQELKYYCFGNRIMRLIQIVGRNDGSLFARTYEPDANNALHLTDIPAEVTPRLYEGGLSSTAARAEAQARKIGAAFDHVRIDFLTNGEDLWLGEMTLYNLAGRLSRGGSDPCHPATRAWDLRRAHFLKNPPQSGWRAVYARALSRELNRDVADSAARRGDNPDPAC